MSQSATAVQTLLSSMAYNREEFKDRVEEKIGGALLGNYKASLASSSGQTRWIEHWQSEVGRLLDTELVVVLLHSIKGFKDRKKAASEVFAHLRTRDDQYRRAARSIVRRDYGVRKLPSAISDEISKQFFKRAGELIDAHT